MGKEELFDFVQENINEIIDLSEFDFMKDWFDTPSGGPISMMDDPSEFGFNGVDYFSAYEETDGYDFEAFKADWDKYNPNVVMVGYELSTIFITDQKLPKLFGNTLSSNDLVFFGSIVNPNEAFKEYVVNGKTLYIAFGIPDPGSN